VLGHRFRSPGIDARHFIGKILMHRPSCVHRVTPGATPHEWSWEVFPRFLLAPLAAAPGAVSDDFGSSPSARWTARVMDKVNLEMDSSGAGTRRNHFPDASPFHCERGDGPDIQNRHRVASIVLAAPTLRWGQVDSRDGRLGLVAFRAANGGRMDKVEARDRHHVCLGRRKESRHSRWQKASPGDGPGHPIQTSCCLRLSHVAWLALQTIPESRERRLRGASPSAGDMAPT